LCPIFWGRDQAKGLWEKRRKSGTLRHKDWLEENLQIGGTKKKEGRKVRLPPIILEPPFQTKGRP